MLCDRESHRQASFSAGSYQLIWYALYCLLSFPQVHLSTHDSINKNTAKASLQQMLSVVFSRMEAKDAQLKEVSHDLKTTPACGCTTGCTTSTALTARTHTLPEAHALTPNTMSV